MIRRPDRALHEGAAGFAESGNRRLSRGRARLPFQYPVPFWRQRQRVGSQEARVGAVQVDLDGQIGLQRLPDAPQGEADHAPGIELVGDPLEILPEHVEEPGPFVEGLVARLRHDG